jgi:predicted alpha/beta-hydrolase family hydrolase
VSPALFLQGDRDATCDIETLRQTLVRVGAPTVLRVVNEADRQFKVLKKSGRTQEDVLSQITGALDEWIQNILGGTT